jgi:RHS repeat-associated protein
LNKSPVGDLSGTRYYGSSASRTSGGLTWLAGDRHGTAQISIDPTTLATTTRRSMPFGETRGAPPVTWANDKGFVGGTSDPTGLTHLGAREYDANIGRFVSADALQSIADPQQWHGYAYSNNNPTTFTDSNGYRLKAPPDTSHSCFVCTTKFNNGTTYTTVYNKRGVAVAKTVNKVLVTGMHDAPDA